MTNDSPRLCVPTVVVICHCILLSGCHWIHITRFHIASPEGTDGSNRVAQVVADVARSLDMQPADADQVFPHGSYIEARSPLFTATRLGLEEAGEEGTIVRLHAWNRGSPWSPDDEYVATERILAARITSAFGDKVVITHRKCTSTKYIQELHLGED
jgi:hypothetical protein